jgi:16S rRNA (uracil1498-N3)-methyltransferase
VRVPRIFLPTDLASGTRVLLPETAARHLVRVLRLGPGAPVRLFDGSGGEHMAALATVEKRQVTAQVGAFDPREAELPFRVVLAQAVSRGDRMDLTLQKAVELGVGTIVPLITARSAPLPSGDRLERRLAHWRGIVVSACEQCGRNRVPEVVPPLRLGTWLAETPAGNRLMLDPEAGRPLGQASLETGAVTLLVGPEGGLDADELAQAGRAGFTGIGLGPRILRTETAALVALAQLALLHPERE